MNSNKSILIIQTGKLGDMILTTPLFYELNRIFPDYKLFVLASEKNYEIPLTIPFIKQFYIYKKNIFSILFLLLKLRRIKFDYVIETKPEYSRTTEQFLKRLKFHTSIGYNVDNKLFDVSLNDYKKGNHAVEINTAPLYYFKPDFTPFYKKPILDSFIKDKSGFKKIDVLINISPGLTSRNWKPENWKNLIELIQEFTSNIRVMYNKNNEVTADYLNHHLSKKIPISKYNLLRKIKEIYLSRMVISPDTAIIHIASAFNVPVIGLYNKVEWNLERFKPLSDENTVLISDNPESINSITHEEVAEKFKELWKCRESNPGPK
jgi:ADP-heptose:LPS heptosyltransferase